MEPEHDSTRSPRLERRQTGVFGDLPLTNHRHPVAQRLHLTQRMAAEEHCTALQCLFPQTLHQLILHERIEAGSGFVQHEQLRLVGQMELRLQESARLGFRRAVVPKGSGLAAVAAALDLQLLEASTVAEALVAALGTEARARPD